MEVEEIFMQRAIQLAQLGNGAVSPNPMVGAVIVHNGRVIGEGYHRQWGEAHAEVNAISSIADDAILAESTMYVTLEPCSHYGKTPPCSQLIVEKNIPRVVIGCLDPFEKVRGRGVEILRNNGVEVEVGFLEKDCREINMPFMTAHTDQRPYVLLKWAQSADGFIDIIRTDRGNQQILSNALTSMWTHRERSRYDAIMVGSNTVKKDDPSLTVRNWVGHNPLRVVIDRLGVIPADSKILNDGGRTLIFGIKKETQNKNVDYVELVDDQFPLQQILKELYKRGVCSLMVEGGATLLQGFIDSNLWDMARIETANIKLEEGIKAPTLKKNVINVEKHGNNIIETINRS